MAKVQADCGSSFVPRITPKVKPGGILIAYFHCKFNGAAGGNFPL